MILCNLKNQLKSVLRVLRIVILQMESTSQRPLCKWQRQSGNLVRAKERDDGRFFLSLSMCTALERDNLTLRITLSFARAERFEAGFFFFFVKFSQHLVLGISQFPQWTSLAENSETYPAIASRFMFCSNYHQQIVSSRVQMVQQCLVRSRREIRSRIVVTNLCNSQLVEFTCHEV